MILNHSHLLVLGSVMLCPTASLSQGYGVQVCAPALGMPPRIQAQGVGCSPPSSPSPWLCPQPPSARWQPRTLTSASNCSAPGLILAHQTVIIGASPALTSLQLVSMAPVSAELQTAHRERGRGAPSSAVGRATGPPPHQHPPSARLCSGAAHGGSGFSAAGGEGARAPCPGLQDRSIPGWQQWIASKQQQAGSALCQPKLSRVGGEAPKPAPAVPVLCSCRGQSSEQGQQSGSSPGAASSWEAHPALGDGGGGSCRLEKQEGNACGGEAMILIKRQTSALKIDLKRGDIKKPLTL